MCGMFEPGEEPPKKDDCNRSYSIEDPAIRYGYIYEEIESVIECVVRTAEGKPKKK
jgi:hypothetical protein